MLISNTMNFLLNKEHEELKWLLSVLQTKIDSMVKEKNPDKDPEEVLLLLNYLVRKLDFHFQIEETLGIYKEISQFHSDLIDKLIGDHKKLLDYLEKIKNNFFNGNRYESEAAIRLKDEFKNFISSLKSHEIEEMKIVNQSSYDFEFE